ncbi:MAG: zinc-binding dehydrogenase [Gammaproteobacteria bacterium]|nr:zinc-binding dehydrogenase [Gammaproteobacteria bacterium]
MGKVVRFESLGGPEVLQIRDEPDAEPGEDEVRIQVDTIGLNRAEVMFRSGPYLYEPQFPSRIGYEAVGVVDAIGPGVEGIAVGDRVSTIPLFDLGRYGVYGETAVVPAAMVTNYPESLTPVQAAALWMAYITAYGALVDIGRVGPNTTVLITAASSSVGLAAIQIAKAEGAQVIATTRTSAKRDILIKAGADAVIASKEEPLSERVMAITNGIGVNFFFDAVGGSLIEELAEAAAPGAQILEYGFLSGEPAPFPAFTAVVKNLCVRGYTYFAIAGDPDKLARCREYIFKGVETEMLRPVVDRVFSLDEIVEAHRYLEEGGQSGKVVVQV